VPSSTSSSERAAAPYGEATERYVPEGAWWGPWLVGVALCALLGLGAELGWRALGHRPTVDAEDLDLWAAERRRAASGRADVLVVLGKSRAQLDLDLPTIRARYPEAVVVQLALRGRGAFAALEDLARDPDFRGRVLWSLTEPDLTTQEADGQRRAVQRARDASPDDLLNARLRARVASRLVVRSAELTPDRVLTELADGRTPPPHFVTVEADRFAFADFSRVDVDVVRAQVEGVQRRNIALMGERRVNPAPWLRDAQRLRPLLELLRARGGDVVLVHLPLTGSSEEFSERFYPKAQFWDRLGSTLGVKTVHYRDVPALRDFDCPDTSHLDHADAPRFTGALLDELARLQFLPRAR
jgi:hypothetical protein